MLLVVLGALFFAGSLWVLQQGLDADRDSG
jgi:hypothetical protein